MVRGKEFPSEGDLVVGTVREVQNFGAFVTLEEFPGKEGFLHIAEVSTGWVKRIRDHVREQQRLVVKVNEHQRREKIQEWKNEQKAEKLLEIAATRLKKTTDQAWDEFGAKLADTYGALYAAFEAAASDEEALATEGFKGAWVKAVNEVARENIVVPFVTVKGYLDLVIPRPDGIKHIREALEAAAKSSDYEDVEISVTYLGAPLYLLKVRAPDYKVAEAQLEKASQAAIKVAKKRGGTAEFRKELKEVTH
jgi:translation initiation factor 2 subunit 1